MFKSAIALPWRSVYINLSFSFIRYCVSSFNFRTFQQLADELKVTVQYIHRIREGKHPLHSLEAEKIGGRWVVAEEEAVRFLTEYHNPSYYTPQDIAQSINMTRKYVLDALTGYGGRKEPRLAGEKRGDRWVISREEGERFIGEQWGKSSDNL